MQPQLPTPQPTRTWVCSECGQETLRDGDPTLQPSMDPRWRLGPCYRGKGSIVTRHSRLTIFKPL